MNPLTPTERRDLRAKAHHLDPVVIVGQHGLTPAVLHEIDVALTKHELVKIKVFSDDRDAREATLAEITTAMDCAPVQHVGKVLVVWRPNPELRKKAVAPKPEPKAKKRAGRMAGVKRTSPRAPVDPVREKRRVALEEDAAPTTGKGRRGAARHDVPREGFVPAGPPREADTSRRKAGEADTSRRKSSYTPKTKPKSFSAKPNPRTAWAKAPPAGSPPKAGAASRRRRTTGS